MDACFEARTVDTNAEELKQMALLTCSCQVHAKPEREKPIAKLTKMFDRRVVN